MTHTGHDINKVSKFIVKSAINSQIGLYDSRNLLDLLATVKRSHELRLNRERQQRYLEKKEIVNE